VSIEDHAELVLLQALTGLLRLDGSQGQSAS